jgi:hypothetical protein
LISPFRPALLCAPSTHALCGRSSKTQRRKLIRCRQPAAHELMGVIQPLASSAPASSANGCKRKRGLWRDDVTARRFPPPWTVEEQAACFVVRDHNGQALSYVYYESEPGRQTAAKPLTKDEVAFDERCKIHDLLMEGVELALKKRGYPALADMKAKWRRKER